MIRFSISILFVVLSNLLIAQKQIIDTSAIKDWTAVVGDEGQISDNGEFVAYYTSIIWTNDRTLVIQSVKNNWKRAFFSAVFLTFSSDNRHAVIQRDDSLLFISLGKNKSVVVANVNSFKQPDGSKGEWIAYKSKENSGQLVLKNLISNAISKFDSVADYAFDKQGQALIIATSLEKNTGHKSIEWVNLKNHLKRQVIWSSSFVQTLDVLGFNFDAKGRCCVVIVKDKRTSQNSIWFYEHGSKHAALHVTDQSDGIEGGYAIADNIPYFSANGKYIFFSVQKSQFIDRTHQQASIGTQVDIWSYKDSVLQSRQMEQGTLWVPVAKSDFLASTHVSQTRVIRIEGDDELCNGCGFENSINADYVLVGNKVSIDEYWWKSYAQKSCFLVSLKDGSRKLLKTGQLFGELYLYSPGGKYVIYFDRKFQNYFSYNFESGSSVDISGSIHVPLGNEVASQGRPIRNLAVGVAGWLPNDSAVFVYDNYDIWQLDPSNAKGPVNITNGYGLKHNIKFRVVPGPKVPPYAPENAIYSPNGSLLLTGFNTENKFNGFYRIRLGEKVDPEVLSIGSYHMYSQGSQVPFPWNFEPRQAATARKWLVKRESSDDAPNFFVTDDFKTFKRLTDLQPQKRYNWLTTKLIRFNQSDGRCSQGILYKPENFDSTKAYPIIFHYYEKLSHRLFSYLQPELATSTINIPWFVSRGYLVFTPDIYYQTGKPGISVAQSLLGAVDHLKKFHWIDTTKMGITGQSFGGYETNFLIANTKIFAAAVSTSGLSDLISHNGQMMGQMYGGRVGLEYNEIDQFRMGATLWEGQDLYIQNSPVFHIDKVTTPILLMANKGDLVVPWMQGLEFFSGLRRLQKKAWLLQYDKGSHGLGDKVDRIDYTIRSTQFFDHYLKGYPPPSWMTKTRSSKLKGIDDRLELDPGGSCGDNCEICQKKRYDWLNVLDVMNPNRNKEMTQR